MEHYIDENITGASLVKDDIPLISNLDILENIAIIKEVHHHKSIASAEAEAIKLLDRISLYGIATNRVPLCSEFEIFCAMFIRALMSDSGKIMIVTPFNLISTLTEIKEIIDVIHKLDVKKDIIIIDMKNNKTNYEGDLCHIVK